MLLQSRIRRARAKKQAIELKAQADQQRKLEEQLQRLKAKLQEVRQRQLTGMMAINQLAVDGCLRACLWWQAGSTQVIVQQDREETLAMLQRLQVGAGGLLPGKGCVARDHCSHAQGAGVWCGCRRRTSCCGRRTTGSADRCRSSRAR